MNEVEIELMARLSALEVVVATLTAAHPQRDRIAQALEEAAEAIYSENLADARLSDQLIERRRQWVRHFAEIARG